MTPFLHRDRIFTVSLVVSLLFHFSMVSLFRIVIYFPKTNVEFYAFEIVDSTQRSNLSHRTLTIPSEENGIDRIQSNRLNLEKTLLPAVEIPTLKFSELDLIRIKQEGLEIRSKYKELFESSPKDSWTTFGNRLNIVGDQLFGESDPSAAQTQLPISRPAPGFEAFLEWMTPPHTRQVLSVEKIDALWGASVDTLIEPLILVFRINRRGNVIFVLPPLEDESGVVDDAVQALFGYRFESVDEDGPKEHHGTLMIRASGERF